MTEVIVVAAPADRETALGLVAGLAGSGVKAALLAPDDPPPQGNQFVLFCVTAAAASDEFFINALRRDGGDDGRGMFALFDEGAAQAEPIASHAQNGFRASGADAAAFAAYVIAHQATLATPQNDDEHPATIARRERILRNAEKSDWSMATETRRESILRRAEQSDWSTTPPDDDSRPATIARRERILRDAEKEDWSMATETRRADILRRAEEIDWNASAPAPAAPHTEPPPAASIPAPAAPAEVDRAMLSSTDSGARERLSSELNAPRRVGGAPRPEGIGAAADPPLPAALQEALRRREAEKSTLRFPGPVSAPRADERPAGGSVKSAPAENVQYARRADDGSSGPPPQPIKLDKVDARAFAPKKLRRGVAELVRVAVFRPKDKGRAMRAAKQADAHTQTAGSQAHLGQISRGAIVAAVIDARGADVEEVRGVSEWTGEPLDFNFAVTPHDDAVQALITIRIFADDAQVGAITFARPLTKAKKAAKPSKLNSQEKLRRVARAFLSYSARDRESVSLIASAYQRAGIPCFFDRSSLSSGEEWSPRLMKEINRADLFHLCWSKQASQSSWVQKEAEHAMARRRSAKKPEITIQMLDGPPWAPHPDSLDALNFDDYARAAVVGYARGEG